MNLKDMLGGESVVGGDVTDNHKEPIVLPKHEVDLIFIEVLVHVLTLALTLLNTIALIILLAHNKL